MLAGDPCQPVRSYSERHKWSMAAHPGSVVTRSLPDDHSVNDGINSEIFSLSYVTVDDAAKAILLVGQSGYKKCVQNRTSTS